MPILKVVVHVHSNNYVTSQITIALAANTNKLQTNVVNFNYSSKLKKKTIMTLNGTPNDGIL